MKRLIYMFAVSTILLSSNAIAQSAPVKISLQNIYNQLFNIYNPRITITSITDNLVIKNILVNKGHYEIGNAQFRKEFFPKKMQYSEHFSIGVVGCNVIRIDVETNQGDWSVEY